MVLLEEANWRRETRLYGSGTVGQHLQYFKEIAACSYKLTIVYIYYELRRRLTNLWAENNCFDIGISEKRVVSVVCQKRWIWTTWRNVSRLKVTLLKFGIKQIEKGQISTE